MAYNLVNWRKEKNLLYIETDKKTHILDFNTGLWNGKTAKCPLSGSWSYANPNIPYKEYIAYFITYGNLFFEFWKYNSKNRSQIASIQTIQAVEKYFSYLDLINYNDRFSFSYLRQDIPKGYIQYLREANETISSRTFEKYQKQLMQEKTLNKFDKQHQKFIKQVIKPCTEGINLHITEWIYSNIELINILYTLTVNSCRAMEIMNIKKFINNIIQYFNICLDTPLTILDNTKTLATNWALIEQYQDNLKTAQIVATQNRIISLNNFVLGDYVLRVPTSLEEFTNEGKQQHNCVGSHYHSSIAKGEDIIVFLRKANNPNESYITCRYHIESESLVECKYFANHNVDRGENPKDYAMLQVLSKMIYNIIEGAETPSSL